MHAAWIEKATNKVLANFYPLRKIINPYACQNNVLTCVYLKIYTTHKERLPLMQLTRKTMRQICELGAKFQKDIYPIEKIESYEKLLPIKYIANKNGVTCWILREVD